MSRCSKYFFAMLAFTIFYSTSAYADVASPASETRAAETSTPSPLAETSPGRYDLFPINNVFDLFKNSDSAKNLPFWGWRGTLEEKGIVFTFVYTGEFDGNTSGGLKSDSTYLGNLDMIMDVDTEKLGGWWGGAFHVYAIDNHGGEKLTGEIVGDFQTASNIEAPRTTKLFELWYEQKLLTEKLSVLVGLHNLNAEFNVTDYGALFLNSSFGIESDISGNVPVSIFPTASLGTRVRWEPCDNFSLLGAVYDGDPQDADINDHGTRIALSKTDGALTIVEPQWHYKLPIFNASEPLEGTLKTGAWYHSKSFDDVADLDDEGLAITHDGNFGGYLILDQMIWRENEEQGLGAFIQFGMAPQDRNTIEEYFGMGLHYLGIIPGRDEDTLGLAYNRATFSDDLRSLGGLRDHERVVELTYQAQLTPAIILQPDFQWIQYPGGSETMDHAKVYLIRFKISF